MTRQYELAGKSGARYRYSSFEEERFLPPAGANFVIARITADGPNLIYAGETDNLASQSWRSALEKARATYADAAVLTRLNVTRAVREAERADLVEEHQPPMAGVAVGADHRVEQPASSRARPAGLFRKARQLVGCRRRASRPRP